MLDSVYSSLFVYIPKKVLFLLGHFTILQMPGNKCYIRQCQEKGAKGLFQEPTDPDEKIKWRDSLGFSVPPGKFICWRHFLAEQVTVIGKKTALIPGKQIKRFQIQVIEGNIKLFQTFIDENFYFYYFSPCV